MAIESVEHARYPHVIDGRALAGTSGRFGEVFDPNTGQVQAQAPFASAAEVDAAVKAALHAQPAWAATNPQRRARVMFEFKRLIEARMGELAELLSSEHGKVLADSRGEVKTVTARWPEDGAEGGGFHIPTMRDL
jgi:malonate-semialdehyde dehydrogenase (acetylating)/methylmalonate-semialdehyde dehydrogenase